MGKQAGVVLYVLALVAVVVGVDILFLRHDIWARLIVNVGIVLVFAAFYVKFLKRPPAQPPQAGLPGSTADPRSALAWPVAPGSGVPAPLPLILRKWVAEVVWENGPAGEGSWYVG